MGPALIRHPAAAILRKLAGSEGPVSTVLHGDESNWSITVTGAAELSPGAFLAGDGDQDKNEQRRVMLEALRRGRAVSTPETPAAAQIAERLGWTYRYAAASSIPAKTSVTELKGLLSMQEQPSYDQLEERKLPGGPDERNERGYRDSLHLQRPKFMEQRGLTPAERGTAYHTVMQHIPWMSR